MSETPAVLFVCLGNICRSPMAEGAFRVAAEKAGLDVIIDSAGTGGWHAGDPPDSRAIATARRHGVDISDLRGRKLSADDFTRFTHILALDRSNFADIRALKPANATAEVKMLLDYVPGRAGQPVADPYYGDADDFEQVWSEVSEAAKGLVKALMKA